MEHQLFPRFLRARRRVLQGIVAAAVAGALRRACLRREPLKIGLILPMTGPVRLDRQADLRRVPPVHGDATATPSPAARSS